MPATATNNAIDYATQVTGLIRPVAPEVRNTPGDTASFANIPQIIAAVISEITNVVLIYSSDKHGGTISGVRIISGKFQVRIGHSRALRNIDISKT